MNWNETSHLAIEALRANKMRAILTMLGVIIGSACIVLVVTIALAGKKYISQQIEAVGSNIVYASLQQSSLGQNAILADQISIDDLDAVRAEVPRVIQAAGSNDLAMDVQAGGKSWPVALIGVTQGFQKIRRLIVFHGRYLDDADFSSVSKVCVISEHLSQRIFPGQNPVGENLHMGELTFTIIGVFRERVGTFGQSEIRTDSVVVPFPLIKYYTGDAFLITLYAQAASADDVPLLTQQVRDVLTSRHRREASYNVENLASILETARNISYAMTVVLLLIAMLALVISGIGIMNIMLVSVTERTREIGIRKAIGARQREILYQFLLEAALISGIGAVIGIVIAVALPISTEILLQYLPVPGGITIPISWLSVFLAFAVSCATGVIFGYLPAQKAARLQPVESLHYE